MTAPSRATVDPSESAACLDPERDAQLLIRPAPGWSVNYGAMVVLSAVIAALGMRLDSAPIVIGAMLVAPVMRPVLGLAFTLITAVPLRGLARLLPLLGATSVALVVVGWGLAVLVPSTEVGLASEVSSRTAPDLRDLVVAVAAGCVGAFATVRPRVADTIPGVAIAVALVPPPVAAGIAIAEGFGAAATGALLLYATNLVAIVFGAAATAVALRVAPGTDAPALDRPRLLGSLVVVAALGTGLGVVLLGTFSDAVEEARRERSSAADRARVAATEAEVTDVVAAWISESAQPNLGVVSVTLPDELGVDDTDDGFAATSGDAGAGTVSVVLLGRTDSFIPALADLGDRIGEVLGEPVAVSVRLMGVADQVNTQFEVDPGLDPGASEQLRRASRDATDEWLRSVERGRILDVAIDDDGGVFVHVAVADDDPPSEALLTALRGIVDAPDVGIDVVIERLVVGSDDAVAAPAPVPDDGSEPDEDAGEVDATEDPAPAPVVTSIVVDGRRTAEPFVCAVTATSAFRLFSGSLFVHVDDDVMTLASASETASADVQVVGARSYVGDFREELPVDRVEVTIGDDVESCESGQFADEPRYRVVGVDPGSELRIRSGFSTDAVIVGAYPAGFAPVLATGQSFENEGRTWLEVDNGFEVGWVAAEFLERIVE